MCWHRWKSTEGKSIPTTNIVADWDDFRLSQARKALEEEIGTNLWAATRLGPLWHDEKAEEHVIRAVWEERIGDATPQAATALPTVGR